MPEHLSVVARQDWDTRFPTRVRRKIRSVADLSDPFMMKLFTQRLGACEYAAVRATFTEHQEKFIRDMRWRLDHREDDAIVGVIWNPTTSQMNYLEGLAAIAAGAGR